MRKYKYECDKCKIEVNHDAVAWMDVQWRINPTDESPKKKSVDLCQECLFAFLPFLQITT